MKSKCGLIVFMWLIIPFLTGETGEVNVQLRLSLNNEEKKEYEKWHEKSVNFARTDALSWLDNLDFESWLI